MNAASLASDALRAAASVKIEVIVDSIGEVL
jgi:hypothetical protein